MVAAEKRYVIKVWSRMSETLSWVKLQATGKDLPVWQA
jgi:hypothetical protein